ncbi:MAG TPA: hypothetical protein VG537_04755 [Candidatus Kapabacteria bacterium]|nr:hypothetical protein [Candidatus Kapabacteria bacterium]
MPNIILFMLSMTTHRTLLRKEVENIENFHLLRKEGENILFSNKRDCFEENCIASLRNFLLAMTLEGAKDKRVHEQVPNTNIKFICPEFKEKMLFYEGSPVHEFRPNTNIKFV